MPVLFTTTGFAAEDQDAALIQGLTSDSEMERCLFRAATAQIETKFLEWADAEHDRGTPTAVIMATAISLHVQMIASVTGQVLPPTTWAIVSELYQETVKDKFVDHAGKAQAAAVAMKPD